MTLRITGLVRIANALRRELAHPLSLRRRDHWRNTVANSLNNVDRILRQHSATPAALPAPSRRAYQFLQSIDWDKLPTTDTPSAMPPRQLSWPGLSALLNRTLDNLAAVQTNADLFSVHATILAASGRIEAGITLHNATPAMLTPSTRQIRGWLAFFAHKENLTAYLAALRLATPLLAPAVEHTRHPMPMRIHFRPSTLLYRVRDFRSGSTLELPTPMISLDAAAFALLAECVGHRDRHAKQRLIDILSQEAYQTLQGELESLAGVAEAPRGAYHDLAAAFDRVNARHFDERISRPRLTWSRAFTGRKFGHYDAFRDIVMVTSTLDRADVPEFVVDYIIFHELLHKKLGTRTVGQRRYFHTPEFYREEKRFPRLDEANAIIHALARHATSISPSPETSPPASP